jgi:hypothetical protein
MASPIVKASYKVLYSLNEFIHESSCWQVVIYWFPCAVCFAPLNMTYPGLSSDFATTIYWFPWLSQSRGLLNANDANKAKNICEIRPFCNGQE